MIPAKSKPASPTGANCGGLGGVPPVGGLGGVVPPGGGGAVCPPVGGLGGVVPPVGGLAVSARGGRLGGRSTAWLAAGRGHAPALEDHIVGVVAQGVAHAFIPVIRMQVAHRVAGDAIPGDAHPHVLAVVEVEVGGWLVVGFVEAARG